MVELLIGLTIGGVGAFYFITVFMNDVVEESIFQKWVRKLSISDQKKIASILRILDIKDKRKISIINDLDKVVLISTINGKINSSKGSKSELLEALLWSTVSDPEWIDEVMNIYKIIIEKHPSTITRENYLSIIYDFNIRFNNHRINYEEM